MNIPVFPTVTEVRKAAINNRKNRFYVFQRRTTGEAEAVAALTANVVVNAGGELRLLLTLERRGYQRVQQDVPLAIKRDDYRVACGILWGIVGEI